MTNLHEKAKELTDIISSSEGSNFSATRPMMEKSSAEGEDGLVFMVSHKDGTMYVLKMLPLPL